MKRLSYILATILMCISINGFATSKDLMRADYLYRQFAFHEAIPYYERATTSPEGQTQEVYLRLADCYRLTQQYETAQAWYSKAWEETRSLPDEAMLHLAEVKMTLQNYEDAILYLEEYQKKHPTDRRVANLLKGAEQAIYREYPVPNGVVTLLSFNSDGSDFGPALRGNELVVTTDSVNSMLSKRDGWTGGSYYNMCRVVCNEKGQCQNAIEVIGGKLNTKYHDGPAAFTANGETMYFTRTSQVRQFLGQQPVSDRFGTVRLQIMIADQYDATSQQYNRISPFKYNDKDYSTAHPAISPDGNLLVFASDMPGGQGQTDLYLCRKEGDAWSRPEPLGPAINTEGNEMFPVFIDNETLSFASNGLPGMGGLDVFVTRIDRASGKWSEPQNVGQPINSSYDDMSLTLYPGGRYGYFSSNRPASRKGDNIYHFSRRELYLSLQVIDSISGAPLDGVAVLLKTVEPPRRKRVDENGRLITRLHPQLDYNIEVSKPGYSTVMVQIPVSNTDRERDTVYATARLISTRGTIYNVVVLDERTKQFIPNPLVVLTRVGWAKPDSAIISSSSAGYTRNLESGYTYNVYAVKENYYGNEKVVSLKGFKPGAAPLSINDTIFMKRLSVGEVYRVDNIYYDYDKAEIREDAMPALNRLIELLEQYPAMRIEINAHTDCRGKEDYNLRLSKARAASVVKYLNQRGIELSRLQSRGFGETQPVHPCRNCDACTEQQHQMNRRTEFRIIAL